MLWAIRAPKVRPAGWDLKVLKALKGRQVFAARRGQQARLMSMSKCLLFVSLYVMKVDTMLWQVDHLGMVVVCGLQVIVHVND